MRWLGPTWPGLAWLAAGACRPADCPPRGPDTVQATFDQGGAADWPGSLEAVEGAFSATAEARRGAGALAGRLRAGDRVNDGVRAELAYDHGDRAGSTTGVAWSLRLASDWPDIDRVENPKGEPNFQILAQFHDQPDCREGETWERYDNRGASPPITVQYLWLTLRDPIVAEVFASGHHRSVQGLDESALERPLLGLFVGDPADLRAVAPIEKGRWHDLRLDVRWSQEEDGWVRFAVDHQEVGFHRGLNMLNAAPHYVKLGLYRHPDLAPEQAFTLDEVLISRDPASVDDFALTLAAEPP